MPQETELHPDDGTDVSPLTFQCTCEAGSYLTRVGKDVLASASVSEYTYVCPTCNGGVVVKVPHKSA